MLSTTQFTLDFLRRDLLKNIVPLKMLAAYGGAMCCFYAEAPDSEGVLLLLPTQVSSFDKSMYPTTDFVVLLASTGEGCLEDLLAHAPRGCNLVFKTVDERQRAAVARFYPVRRVTSFISYTSAAGATFAPAEDVVVADEASADCRALFAAQGHKEEDVDFYFSPSQAGQSFALYRAEKPAAACFATRNYEQVFEVGGVYTLPVERRKGYARRAVETALSRLLAQGRIPRYQVREENAASRALAEAVGLEVFVITEHWLHEG